MVPLARSSQSGSKQNAVYFFLQLTQLTGFMQPGCRRPLYSESSNTELWHNHALFCHCSVSLETHKRSIRTLQNQMLLVLSAKAPEAWPKVFQGSKKNQSWRLAVLKFQDTYGQHKSCWFLSKFSGALNRQRGPTQECPGAPWSAYVTNLCTLCKLCI